MGVPSRNLRMKEKQRVCQPSIGESSRLGQGHVARVPGEFQFSMFAEGPGWTLE